MSDYPATQLVKATDSFQHRCTGGEWSAIQKSKSSRLTGLVRELLDRFGEALKVSWVMKDIPASCDHLFVKRKAMSMIQTKSLDLFAGIPAHIPATRHRGRVGGSGASVRVHCSAARTRWSRYAHALRR